MKTYASISNPNLRLDNYYYEHRKYRILQYLNSLPHHIAKELKRQLPELLSVNRQTFANWLNACKSDTVEVPSYKLAIIAKALNVPLDSLFNLEIPAINFKTPQVNIINSAKKTSILVS